MKKIIVFASLLLIPSLFIPSAHGFQESLQQPSPENIQVADSVIIPEPIPKIIPEVPQVNSASYILYDLSTGEVVMGKNINEAFPIASITKLMNAVVVLEQIDTDTTIKITREMLWPYGSSKGLFVNKTISAHNLLKTTLTQSVNDAAQALSYFIGNEQFISLMNEKAQQIGMANTHFSDVHGLSPDDKSTPADLAKLLQYIYINHPQILAMTKDTNVSLRDSRGRWTKVANYNIFTRLSSFIGGKTGYIPEAKQTMASVFEINGRPMAVVVLYSQNQKQDTLHIVNAAKTI